MRRITKLPVPSILEEKASEWTAEYIADPNNKTKKFRYRHKDVKSTLVQETASKCVYCESKIGHNTPGDVEHKIPSSVNQQVHFEWDNLTIACTECNRRKNAYYSTIKPFLDPYSDDVENRLVHQGPIVCWSPGDTTAEATVRTLQLNDMSRRELISRKVETIEKLNNVVARLSEGDPLVRELMEIRLRAMKAPEEEYSGMIIAICETYGL